MQIRTRLTYQFVALVALLQLLSSMAIYFSAADYRKTSFFEQLKSIATNKVVLLMELENLAPERLEELSALGARTLESEHVFVFNFKNELLYSSTQDSELNINSNTLEAIRMNKAHRFEHANYEMAGLLFADRYNGLVVVAAGRDITGKNQLSSLRNILIVVFSLSLAFIWALAWMYAGQALQPISLIIQQVEKIRFSNLSRRLKSGKANDELSRLTETFNEMLERIEQGMSMQRNFVANASHELRTPLTAIQGQLEVLLLKDRAVNEYQTKIQSVLDDIRKLTDIANRLLLLAHANSENANSLFKKIPLADLLWQTQFEIQKSYPAALIHITLNDDITDSDRLMINGNEQLLGTVFTNLFENAIKFSPKSEVFVHMKVVSGGFEISIHDEGIGIPEAEIEYIFQPFFRSSNAQHIHGHGIGLSLVERIVQLHQGMIKVISKPGQGSTFTILLPS